MSIYYGRLVTESKSDQVGPRKGTNTGSISDCINSLNSFHRQKVFLNFY